MDASMAGRAVTGRALTVLTILGCLGVVTAVTWLLLRDADPEAGLGSLALSVVLILAGIAVVNVVLIAVDNWLDQGQPDANVDRHERGKRS